MVVQTAGLTVWTIRTSPSCSRYEETSTNKGYVLLWLYYFDAHRILKALVTPHDRQWAHAKDLLVNHPENQIDSFIMYIKSSILICEFCISGYNQTLTFFPSTSQNI